MTGKQYKKIMSHIPGVLLFVCVLVGISGCSSENKPIAEVYIGDWNIYSATGTNAGTGEITGKIIIDLGNDVVIFSMNFDNERGIVELSGIVYNSSLYSNSSHDELLGKLKIEDGTLHITIVDYDGVVFKATKN